MKTFLSLGALGLVTPAMTASAAAWCVTGQWETYYVVCPAPVVEPPKQRHEKAHRPAPVHHVTKHPKLQQREEKAPPTGAPPALPPR